VDTLRLIRSPRRRVVVAIRFSCGTFHHAALNIESTPHRIDYTAELSQHPVAGVLDNPSTVLSNFGFDQGAQMLNESGVRPLLVQTNQPAIPSHIGRQDGCGPSLYGQGWFSRASP